MLLNKLQFEKQVHTSKKKKIELSFILNMEFP
jgi:hypothetical protein